MNVAIDALRLRFTNAAGHAHRIERVTQRAVVLLASRLQAARAPAQHGASALRTIAVDGVALDRLSDEDAAAAIADAVASSLANTGADARVEAAWRS